MMQRKPIGMRKYCIAIGFLDIKGRTLLHPVFRLRKCRGYISFDWDDRHPAKSCRLLHMHGRNLSVKRMPV